MHLSFVNSNDVDVQRLKEMSHLGGAEGVMVPRPAFHQPCREAVGPGAGRPEDLCANI